MSIENTRRFLKIRCVLCSNSLISLKISYLLSSSSSATLSFLRRSSISSRAPSASARLCSRLLTCTYVNEIFFVQKQIKNELFNFKWLWSWLIPNKVIWPTRASINSVKAFLISLHSNGSAVTAKSHNFCTFSEKFSVS